MVGEASANLLKIYVLSKKDAEDGPASGFEFGRSEYAAKREGDINRPVSILQP